MKHYLVYVTCPDETTAVRLGKIMIGERLAACVNVLPGVRSLYEWDGVLRDECECILLAKTTIERFVALRDRLCALHPYDCPCVVALELAAGHEPLLSWISASVHPLPEDRTR